MRHARIEARARAQQHPVGQRPPQQHERTARDAVRAEQRLVRAIAFGEVEEAKPLFREQHAQRFHLEYGSGRKLRVGRVVSQMRVDQRLSANGQGEVGDRFAAQEQQEAPHAPRQQKWATAAQPDIHHHAACGF